jgi:heme exporter protein D
MFSEPFAPNLKAALGLWLAVLILVVVILAFAIVDWFANRAYLRRVIKELQHRRDELLAEAKAFRKAQD